MTWSPEEISWIVSGAVLVLIEFIIPGMVSVFLGCAAVIVGLMLHFNWINGTIQALGSWFALSTFLILTVRQIASRFFLSDTHYKYTEEDSDAIGQIVDVTETIHSSKSDGRIRYQGTDWPAHSMGKTIKKGKQAVIKYRDNISWVVEPYEEKEIRKK